MTTELLKEQTEGNEITTRSAVIPQITDCFASIDVFEQNWRMAKALSMSQLIPQNFQGKAQDCLIAIDMSRRMGASPFMILQNMYIVHGKPAWSSQFLIACINSCGKFSPLRYKPVGEKGKSSYGYIAYAIDNKYKDTLEGPAVTMEMAEKEGWVTKAGSKWKTMPDLMLRYRAATFFARMYAPELTMGMKTDDEVIDIETSENKAQVTESRFEQIPVSPAEEEKTPQKSDLELLQEYIDKNGVPVSAEEIKNYVEGQGEIFSFDIIKPNINRITEAILNGNGKK